MWKWINFMMLIVALAIFSHFVFKCMMEWEEPDSETPKVLRSYAKEMIKKHGKSAEVILINWDDKRWFVNQRGELCKAK